MSSLPGRRALAVLERGGTVTAAARASGLSIALVRRIATAVGLVEHPDGTMRYTPPNGPAVDGRTAGGHARAASADYPAAEVRAWARTHGIPCPGRGRYLPADVVDAWRRATHP